MQDWKSSAFKTLVPLCLLFGLLIGTQAWLIPSKEQMPRLSAIDPKPILASQNRMEQRRSSAERDAGLADSFLITDILSIIHNYYVDEARVENRSLLEGSLIALERQDIVRLSFKDNDHWSAARSGEVLNFDMSGRYSFDELIRDSVRLSKLLEKKDKSKVKSKDAVKKQDDASGPNILLRAMLSSLDPHSNLLNSEEYRDLKQGTEGSFGGLGVVVGMQDEVLTVVKPLPKSPASRAGVSKFDRIMQIDNKTTFGTTLDDLIQYMRGEPGTKVRLSLLKEGDVAPRNIMLTREVIQVDSVEWKLLDSAKGKIFYSFIDSFSSRTAIELKDALVKAQQQQKGNLSGIILDLRSNPGGLLDQAVKVADLFLDEGKILTTQGRSREFDLAKRSLQHFDYPIVILNNGDTASASEIVAGALRDHGRALIVGEPSFGKGSVQTVFEVAGEQALKLTIARYYTPKGISIQNTGIMPDIWLQPMLKTAENVNLLGDYRYKSERFLDHSLDQSRIRQSNIALDEQKAFYLVSPEDAKKEAQKDVPLEFSVKLLAELAKRDGIPFPPERLRASYWQASASHLIKKSLADFDAKSQAYLKNGQKIDWSSRPFQGRMDKAIQFDVKVGSRLQLREGSRLELPWAIRNDGKVDAPRLSVYLSAMNGSLGTNEILVGKVKAGETVRGVLKFDLAVDAKEGPIRLRAGLARSGWPVMGKDQEFGVELTESQEPKISMDLSLIQEEGGKLKGVLEPGENAKLKLVLKNVSNVTASQIEMHMFNLAGTQIKLDASPIAVDKMQPGETRVVFIPLQAMNNLVTETFECGASLKSREHVTAEKMHFSVPSLPNARVSKSEFISGVGSWKEN